jgi:NTP pyrophosphatase (non-canonical NTP hydrolase)
MIDAFNLNNAFIQTAVAVFGDDSRIQKAIEECAELIVALRHFKDGRIDSSEVATEIADVYLAVQQLAYIFGPALVDQKVQDKVQHIQRIINERLRDKVDAG